MADIIIGFLQRYSNDMTYLVYDILFIATKSGFVGILDADIVETQ